MIPLLLSLQAAKDSTSTPGNDPRLAAPARLSVICEAVGDAIAGLGKERGCTLEVAVALKDRKVGIHTEAESLGKTLDQLGQVLDAKWSVIPNGWRLDPISERMSELGSYLAARDLSARAQVQDKLEGDLKLVRKMSFPAYVAKTTELEEGARNATNDADREKLQKQRAELGYDMDLVSYLAAYTYGSLGEGERKRFWAGEVFYATSAAFPGGRALPEGASRWRDRYDSGDEQDRGDLRIFIRFDPSFGQLLTRLDRDGMMSRRLPGLAPTDGENLARHPFLKRQAAWSEDAPFASRQNEPAKVLPEPGKGPWDGGFWSVAEVLKRFHERTGIPVVAMAGRQPWPVASPDYDGKRYSWDQSPEKFRRGTVGAAIGALRSVGAQVVHESDGFLLVRPDNWYDRLNYESPESVLRPFEWIAKPSIDDYAVLATRLTDRQILLLGRASESVFGHLRYPFEDGPAMLRL